MNGTISKQKLKDAMIRMLEQKHFEDIHVIDLCREAHVSRVTFYNWYSDKYELLDDIFQDEIQGISEEMERMQKKNNPEDDPIRGYCNLMDAVLVRYDEHYRFFSHASKSDDTWLYYYFYISVLHGMETMLHRYRNRICPEFDDDQMAAFLCGGMWDFIRVCKEKGMGREEILSEAEKMMTAVLHSRAFHINF